MSGVTGVPSATRTRASSSSLGTALTEVSPATQPIHAWYPSPTLPIASVPSTSARFDPRPSEGQG